MSKTPLELTRAQILAHRRRVGALDQRLPAGRESLERAALAGLQDSMPRAAITYALKRGPQTWASAGSSQVDGWVPSTRA